MAAPKGAKSMAQGTLNLQDEQTRAVEGNMANQSSIEALVSRGNAFNASQAKSLAEQTMPGYTKLSESLTNRAQQLADHPYDVPKEVQDNLARIAAERGISAGTRGQFNDFSLLRDLGVNQLQYGQTAINQAQTLSSTLVNNSPRINPMSPLSFYVTPSQQASATDLNNSNTQATSQAQANADAAQRNAQNADLWGSLTKIAGQYSNKKTGVGGSTNYDDFIRKNPNSSAATYGLGTD